MTPIHRLRQRVGFVVGGCVWLAIGFGVTELSSSISAQQLPAPLSYSAAQAALGQSVYAERCASCHGENLDDGAYGLPLKGADFRQKWGSKPLDPLFILTVRRSGRRWRRIFQPACSAREQRGGSNTQNR